MSVRETLRKYTVHCGGQPATWPSKGPMFIQGSQCPLEEGTVKRFGPKNTSGSRHLHNSNIFLQGFTNSFREPRFSPEKGKTHSPLQPWQLPECPEHAENRPLMQLQ